MGFYGFTPISPIKRIIVSEFPFPPFLIIILLYSVIGVIGVCVKNRLIILILYMYRPYERVNYPDVLLCYIIRKMTYRGV